MRYIKKKGTSAAATLLKEWRNVRAASGQSLKYEDFNKKSELNDQLRQEQYGVCCYCQQRIDHYQGNNIGGSHNEHFIPQNGNYGDEELQTDYFNIFACCNYSKGLEINRQHCGEAKHDQLINHNFLADKDCAEYFKYNVLGEILPNCPLSCWTDCLANIDELTDIQKDAVEFIRVTNLNEYSLVNERKRCRLIIEQYAATHSAEQLEHKILEYNTTPPYIPFIDMQLFFMNKYVKLKRT